MYLHVASTVIILVFLSIFIFKKNISDSERIAIVIVFILYAGFNFIMINYLLLKVMSI